MMGDFSYIWFLKNICNFICRIGNDLKHESLYNDNNKGDSFGSIGQLMVTFCRCPYSGNFGVETAEIECTFEQFNDKCLMNYMDGLDKNRQFRKACFERKKRATQQLAKDTTDQDAPPFMYNPDYIATVSENVY